MPRLPPRILFTALLGLLAAAPAACLQPGMAPRSADVARHRASVSWSLPVAATIPVTYFEEGDPGPAELDAGDRLALTVPGDAQAAASLRRSDRIDLIASAALHEIALGVRFGPLSETLGAPLSIALGVEGLVNAGSWFDDGVSVGARVRLDASRRVGPFEVLANGGLSYGTRIYDGAYDQFFARGMRTDGQFFASRREARLEGVLGLELYRVRATASGYRRVGAAAGLSCETCTLDNDWGLLFGLGFAFGGGGPPSSLAAP